MFGGLVFLVGGKLSVAVSGTGRLIVRVDPEETDVLLAKAHAQPFEMRGRAMPGTVAHRRRGRATKRRLEPWVRRGVACARSLSSKRLCNCTSSQALSLERQASAIAARPVQLPGRGRRHPRTRSRDAPTRSSRSRRAPRRRRSHELQVRRWRAGGRTRPDRLDRPADSDSPAIEPEQRIPHDRFRNRNGNRNGCRRDREDRRSSPKSRSPAGSSRQRAAFRLRPAACTSHSQETDSRG
jgi:hypothetical protein